MPLNLILCLLLFPVVIVGLAWPMVSRFALDAAEKLGATVALSLLGAYLLAFACYLLHLRTVALWALPLLAAIGLITGRRALVEMLADRTVRALLAAQLLLAGWCLGWLSFIVSYSGGGWSGDWLEHWHRTRFFLEHWPLQMKFLTLYYLPARPPLANLVTGALIGPTGANFTAFQVVTTLLNCLVFLPAALLVRRFQRVAGPSGSNGGQAAVAWFAVLLMLNPSFLENTTFAWTKLFAAFFVLGGLYFFLRAHDASPPPAATPLCAACLAAAVLTHYSAVPYVVLLGLAWFCLHYRQWNDAAFWRLTAVAGAIGGVILATWFGWSLGVYGGDATFSNSSSAGSAPAEGSPLGVIGRNLWDTLVPHFLRQVDLGIIAQRSPWGYWRDWFFAVYQINLLFIFGSVGWIVLVRELARGAPAASPRSRCFWAAFVGGVVVFGVAVVRARNDWGLAHICLQALLLLGLGYLAARWATLGRGWRWALIAGLAFDFCAGIVLQFAVQAYLPDRWFTPGRSMAETEASYTVFTQVNAYNKLTGRLDFFGDVLRLPGAVVVAVLAGILTLAVTRAARRPR